VFHERGAMFLTALLPFILLLAKEKRVGIVNSWQKLTYLG